MSKYGDDYVCTCEMDLVSCKNEFHAESCQLWNEPTFVAGSDEWDGDLGCLVLARNPWDEADQWIWNGDTPVVRRQTAEERTQPLETIADIVAEWECIDNAPVEPGTVEFVGKLEQEALDALTSGAGTEDEFGMICLPDGSFADFEIRVTYRRTIDADGHVYWDEILWDNPITMTLEQAEANMAKPTCTCKPLKRFYCAICKVKRDNEGDEWQVWEKGTSRASGPNNTAVGYGYDTTGDTGWSKCSHAFETFRLPGKQTRNIKISGKRNHTPTTTPDFGLYAYGGWNPACTATFIPWQDYGLPTCSFETAALAIKTTFDQALIGHTVEVGCMGGHGRTGTILACMALLSDEDLSPRGAIAWVRKVHCNEAIETNEQEWFVAWFKSWLTGSECPPKPTHYVSKHSANWQAATTAATAVKEGGAVLPATVPSGAPSAANPFGQTTMHNGITGTWCDGCKRFVYVQHNDDCMLDYAPGYGPEEGTNRVMQLPVENNVLAFDPSLIQGETANKRRRNAKRANRRAARRAQRNNAKVLQSEEV